MTRKQRMENVLLILPRIRRDFKDLQTFLATDFEKPFLRKNMLPGDDHYHDRIENEILKAGSLWELGEDALVALECYLIELDLALVLE